MLGGGARGQYYLGHHRYCLIFQRLVDGWILYFGNWFNVTQTLTWNYVCRSVTYISWSSERFWIIYLFLPIVVCWSLIWKCLWIYELDIGQLFTQSPRRGHPCTLDTFLVDLGFTAHQKYFTSRASVYFGHISSWFGFYSPSKLFHSLWAESIIKRGENGRSPRQNTWKPTSRTWFVSHITRARHEPTAVRWWAI